MSKFYQLKIANIKKETEDAVSVMFDVPEALYSTFNYKPGQYVTLRFHIKGKEERRSYSICSSPVLDELMQIGVKRVKNGLVSNYINDTLKEGDLVDVMPPDGRFFAEVNKNNYKTYYLFAAGSGITPILSILKTVLQVEERSYVYMIYGNKKVDAIMFKEELDKLQESFGDRFILEFTLSRPNTKWSDLWANNTKQFFRKGRIDSETVKWFINEYPLYAQNAEYYICGPGTMIENTKKTLKTIDVPDTRIFIESFGGIEKTDDVLGVENAKLTAYLDNEIIEVHIPKGKTVLRTLIEAGKEPPYSCEGGICSTCICKLEKGKVHMRNNLSLTDKDLNEGYILSCQSIPLSEELVVNYE